MTSIPPLRPTETGSTDVEPAAVLRGSSPVRTAAAIAAAAAVFLAVVVLAGVGRLDTSVPAFLEDALGPEKAEAPLERTPATGVGVRINDQGYTVSHWGVSISVASEDVGGADWRRHVHGVTRETDFGTETIVVNGRKTEEFLTVMERQGKRTWRWKLASRLHPRLGANGAVTFLDPTRHRVTSLAIDPVRILDGNGNDVTPEGLRWGLEESGSGWLLTLELDDADLPLPYVIDPAVTHRAAQTSTTAGATSLQVSVPAGVQANDLLVAHIARVSNATINTPSGWTAAGGTNNGNFLRQATYYRVAGASEPASYTWTWTGTQPAAGGMSAYYGVKASAPVDVIGTAATGNNTTTVTAPSLTTGANDALVLAFFSSNTNSTYSTAAGMSERYEAGTSGAASIAADDMTQAGAGATGSATATAAVSGRVVGHQVSFNVDDVAPTGGLLDPGSILTGTVVLAGSAADTDSAVASVLFQRSPANAGTWTDLGVADTTSPYSVSFDTTSVADGLYDLRLVITDVAGNVTNSTIVEDRRVDNTVPASNTTFPASSGNYNAAGWDTGCGTSGFCGTYSDGGSGVSQVEISIRQGSGDYWSAGSFSSASEAWNAAATAAGNWSYAFAAASFPAQGSYTIRVRAVDAAGNVESPNARTFTIDPDAPETAIDSSPANPTSASGASFAFSSDEVGSTFECRLDGGSWGACTSPKSYASLADGSHTFEVRATDVAGNTDGSPASFTWLVDTTAPSSTTSFPAANGEHNAAGWAAGCGTEGLCGTYSDGAGAGVAEVEISIRQGTGSYWDGSGFTSASEAWNDASLAGGDWSYSFDSSDFPADGNYTVRVRAVDAVANTETPSSRTFAYDTTSPSAVFDFPASGGNYADAAWDAGCATSGFCGTQSDSLSGVAAVEVSIQRVSTGLYWNGSSFSSASESFETATLAGGDWSLAFAAATFPADGQYTVHVRATDDAGNTESGPSRMFRIDNTAPSSTVTFPASSGTYNAAAWNAGCATSGLCGTHSDGGSGVQGVEVSIRQGAGNYWNGSGFSSGTEVWNAATLAGGDWSLAFPAGSFPADGSYTVRVRAADNAGNVETPSSRTFAIDRAAPQTTIDSNPADPTASTSADFDFSADEGGSTFECRIDGGAWSACTSPESYAGLADGSHTFDVRATDVAGNTDGSPASFTWLVDTAAPSSTVAFPTSSGTYNAAAWNAGCAPSGLCGAYDDGAGSGVAEVEVSLRQGSGDYWDGSGFTSATEVWNDADLAAGDWSYDFEAASLPADGDYTVRVRARDDVGNTEGASSRTFTIDRAAPQTTIDSTPADPTASTSADFDFSADEVGSAFECRIDGGAWGACTSPKSYAGLADGSHTFDVRATDVAGNTDGSPASFTWLVDTTAPASAVIFPAIAGSYTDAEWDAGCTAAGLCGTYSDGSGAGVAEVEISLRQGTGDYWDGSGFTSATEVWNDADLAAGEWNYDFDAANFPADGSYTVRVRARDAVANVQSPSSRTFEYDATAPSSTVAFPAAAGVYNVAGWDAGCPAAGPCGTYFDGTSGVAEVEVSLRQGSGDYWDGSGFTSATEVWNDADLAAGDWSYDFEAASLPADGDYTVRVRARDVAGNVQAPSSGTFTFDSTEPETSIDSIMADPTSSTSASFDFSADEPGSTFECAVDGGAWVSCTSPKAYTGLGDGGHTFEVRATDTAGNTDGNPASFSWTVDTVAPSSTATFPADAGIYTAAEWDAGCAPAGLCGTYSDTGVGVIEVEVSIRRGSGNYWDGSVFTSAGEVWNDADLAAGDWSYDLDSSDFPADGSYTVRLRARDDAGNTESASNRTFTFDATAPSSTTSFPAASGEYNAAGWDAGCTAPGLCGTYADAASGVAEVEVSIRQGSGDYWDGSGFTSATETWNDATLTAGDWNYDLDSADFPADGDYTVRVRARDVAGNTETASTRTFTYDTTAPQTAIDANPSDPSGSADADFDFSADEAGSTFECRIDGGAWIACTSPHGFVSLADGSHTFEVRATDDAGNTDASPASFTWLIDTTAPSSTTTFPVASESYTAAEWDAGCATAGLCGTYGDGGGSGVADVEISIRQGSGDYWDGSGFTSATETWNDADLTAGDWNYDLDSADFPADGDYTVRVRARDAVGNTEAASSRTFDLDATAPQTTIDVTPPDPTAADDADFEFSASELDSTFECRIDGGAWIACTSPKSYTSVADGSHTFQVRATDQAGNIDGSPATHTWLVDTTAPSSTTAFPVTSESYTAAEWDAGCATAGLCGTYGDGGGSGVADVEISIHQGSGDYWDGSGFTSATEVWNDANLTAGDWAYALEAADFPADGDYTVRVRARDAVGNIEGASSRTFEVDATGPSSAVAFPADAAHYNAAGWAAGCTAAGLCGTYSDATSGVADVEVSIRRGTGDYWDGSGFTSATEVWNDANLTVGDWAYDLEATDFAADGDYTVRVRARDVAGNTEPASTRTFTYDTTAPQTTVDSSPSDPTASNDADFDFSADEAGSTFECRLDGGAWGACTSPQSYTSLADGSHTFQVRATDQAGNTDGSPATHTWLVDTTAPTSTTDFPTAAGDYNAAAWNAGCTTSGLCGTYGDGGGSGVDLVEISIRQGTGDYWDGSGFTSATEVWNDADLTAGDWNYDLDSADFPADGDYTVRVRAGDVAGNTEAASTRTFTYDTTDPSATFAFPAAGGEYSTAGWNAGCATAGFCGSQSDGGSGVAAVEISIRRVSEDLYWDGDSFDAGTETYFTTTLSGGDWSYAFPAASFPADGQYAVHVRATDDAGNTESGPSRTFRIDDTDPSAVFTFPAAGARYSTSGWNAGCPTAGVCGTYSDAGSGVAEVEVSLKRNSTDLYWDGDSFDAAGETYVTATTAGGDWSFDFPAASFPADGGYTLHVRATDDAGNVEGGSTRTFTYDTTAPQTTVDSSPSDPTASNDADFDFSADEAGSTFECRLDGGAWGACTSPQSYTSLADGSHTFQVRATDQAGNTDGSPATHTWLVDTTAPTSTTDFPTAAGDYNAAAWNAGCTTSGLCGTYGDGAGAGVNQVQVSVQHDSTGLYWNGAAFSSAAEVLLGASLTAGDWTRAFPASNFPADGDYTVRVFATDEVGNAETPATRTFGFDATAPTGSLTAPADGAALRGASVTVSSDSADSGSGVATAEYQQRPAGGGAWTEIDTDTSAPYSVAWDTTPLADGDYDLRIVTTDEAGNTFASATRTVTVDNTAPSAATLDTLPGAIRNGQELTGSGADATSGIESLTYLYCEGTSCTPATPIGSSTTGPDYSVTWTGQPADGDARVRVRVSDRAGNTLDSAIQDVVVDNTNPTGFLTAPGDAEVVAGASVTVSSDSADAGSSVASAEFQQRPAGGGAWAEIDTDTNSPYSIAWDTTSLTDGDYDLRVVTTDEAGNTFASATRTVTVDNNAPSVGITAPSGFVNAAAPDPFTVTASTPDGDVEDVELFRCSNASAGCSSGSWASLGVDTTAPYSASWAIDPDGNRALRAVATDGAGNTGADVVNVTVDRTNPTGALTAPADAALVTGASVAVSSNSADAGSGVASAEFQQRPAGGGAWTEIDTDTSAPYAVSWDTTPIADGDYDLRAVTIDEAGNTFASATRTVTVDNSAPSAPALTLSESSPFAYVSGSEVFVNTDETGSYDVDAASADAHSGIDKVRFPGPVDDSSSPYSASFAFGDLSGSQTVTAFNGAGLTASSPFTVTPDTAEPAGGSVSYADGYDADGGVSITVDAGTDALSGVAPASAVLERRTAPLAGGSCDPFAGAWSAVVSPDSVASGQCAQYRYRVSDRVGNEAVYTSANVVKVDLANPIAPVLTLDESSPFAHVVGTEIFVNTNETGLYDVQAATSDAASGIDKVVFPGGVEDASSPYAAAYDFDDLLGVETVTAHDRAGNTASADFEVTEDISASSTTDDTGTIGSGWQTAPVTVTLTPTDARSGVAATYYTTDGSVPTTSSGEGTSVDLTADGVYTIRYFSVDNVGNVEPVRTAFATIRIDQTSPSAPAITLDESSPYAHVSGAEIFVNSAQTGSFDVSATSSDPGSGIDRIAFPGGVEDVTSPYSATYDLDELSGAQTVTAHDAAGNTASDTFTVTPDTAAPTGGLVSYPDGYDADGAVTITADAGTDALSGVNAASGVIERRTSVLVGGVCDPFVGGWSAVTSPDTVADSTCARYRYRVSDRVGNEAIYTLPTSTVKVDLTAPQTTIDSAPADPSNDASPGFQFSSSEVGSTFECRLDGGAWGACTSPRSYASLADGSHTFQVRATDAAGHTDATPASHTWAVDTVGPNTSFEDIPADPSDDDAPTLEFSASEPGSTFECRLDGGAWGACSSPETIGLLADGSHTYEVRATDAAGNTDATPASHTWTVDTVAPESSFSVVPADPTNDTTPTFEFTASEPGSTFECRLDAGAWGACASPATAGPLADGSHTFEVRATDAAGNQEAPPESYTWVVDAGPPTVSITQPAGFVNASDADPYTVRATSPDGDITGVELFRCDDESADCSTGSWVSLGTDATAPYEASWPLDADGNRALRAVVTDVAANTGEAVVDVTIDRTVPGTTVDSAPADPSGSTSASFSFSSSEPGASFACRRDGGAWEACSSPKGYTGLAEGNHTFEVRATDAAGNVDPTPAAFAWTVDTVAPQTTIDAAPSDPSASPAPSFEFSSSEPGSTFECRLDGGAWDACASPHGYAGLADGSHTFQVRATDAAGNVDGSPATHTWTIDATPPGGGLADPGQFLRGTVALTASPSDTGAGVESVDFQVSPANADSWTSLGVDTTDPYSVDWDTTALADGVYDLRIVVTDNASNASPSAVVEDRVVDNTAPGAAVNDPGAYLRGTISLTANASDAGSGVATVAFERSPAGAGTWTPVAASWDTTTVADGLYDLRVTVTDNAGNSSVSAPVANRRVDNTKPSLTASTPADGSTLASAGSLAVIASEDVAGIVGATIDGAAAPAPVVAGSTVTYTHSFATGPHILAGELEDLAGNRQPIRVHFTTWTGATADYPYVEKNSNAGLSMSLRSTSDTTTVTVPAGAWTGAPTGDWLVLRIDPQPAAGGSGGFEPASEVLDVTAYWALTGSSVTSFSLPLGIEIDNTQAHVVPAVFENGAWRPIAQVSGSSLPASWNDGFEYDGTDVRILTRHLSLFTLLEDAQAPTKPGSFKGTVSKGKFSLSWAAASDNSGLVSAYRVYANGVLVKTVAGSQRTVAMGTFKATDKRSFQVAAVDAAGNVGPRSVALKVVPKVTKLTLAAAKSALKKRGFKVGKVTYKASSSVAKGEVIKGSPAGLAPAGSKVALSVSKGKSGSARPTTPATTPPPPVTPPLSTPTAPTPSTTPPPATPTTTAPTTTVTESSEPRRGRVLPFVGARATSLSDLRQELGFGLLAAAFSIAAAVALRARRPALGAVQRDPDQIFLWDQRIIQAVRSFFRLP